MTVPVGEMPFLEHLEELRGRILRSLAAVVVGFGVGLWLVQRFQLVTLLKEPIAPFLLGGKLTVLSPTEPVRIVFELGFVIGLVLASPVILWQVWAFLAPALYAREKKALVPALFVGTLLFLTGAAVAYLYVVPQALRVLFSFQSEAIAPMVTYDAYFDFILQVVLALGLSFELPLVIIILSALGIVTPAMLHRFRRFAIVGACIAGALLSPGADLISMVMMTVPLLVLYEVGFLGAVVLHRRRLRRAAEVAAVLLVLALGGAGRAWAQQPTPPPSGPPSAGDTARRAPPGAGGAGETVLDTAQARRLGLPTAPSRKFAEPDSALSALLDRPGYDVTRFRADSATLYAHDKRLVLEGEAMAEQRGATLEADSVGYSDAACELTASGDPRLFQKDQVLVGTAIRYNTCDERGVVRGGFTRFQEGGTEWFIRGSVANDSSSTRRIFAASSEITSCDLPVPHYHFAAGKIKWVSQSVLVARPIVLYVADVPILWLPFILQDTRPGRHSGILVPQFGINDLVRTSSTYDRQITNIGYYWAASDFFDAQFRLDWYSRRYVQLGVRSDYRSLSRFMNGSLALNRQFQSGGGSSFGVEWSHQQQFSAATTLASSISYVTNTTLLNRNAVDPRVNTQNITSRVNLSRKFRWGNLNLGGNRTQEISSGRVSTTLPTLGITPNPLTLSPSITWSPTLSVTNQLNTTPQPLLAIRPGGVVDSLSRTLSARQSTVTFDSPIRFGAFTWGNTFAVVDSQSSGGQTGILQRVPDLSTPDPNDSVTITRTYSGNFGTGIDWSTRLNLPIVFRNTWKIQPSVSVVNVIQSQPYALRNRNTSGAYVFQKKTVQFQAQASPSLFGFYAGHRMRHTFSPQIIWAYSPSASVSDAFASAISTPGLIATNRVNAAQTVSVGLNQTFEVKGKPPKGDTLGLASPNVRKIRVLSISTSPITYDFEKAKRPDTTGWVTPSITNTLQSDLLPGFSLQLTHDLWRGQVGSDTAVFHPYLTALSTSFNLSSNTFRALGGLVGLGGGARAEAPGERPYIPNPTGRGGPGNGFFNTPQPNQAPFGGTGLTAAVTYTLQRQRPPTTSPAQQNLALRTSFRLTPNWMVDWNTQYNFTGKRFESNDLSLMRDLHDWRISFSYVKNGNGNVAFYFSIFLIDLPQLKISTNGTTIGQ